ncbi:hypothetical protein Afer_0161 [Acidimicrobium ferrooxidans DSM 10331]|uniref:Uncharacterized protein n=1 Tax=Acidimicrobium ferrooxidans (strain DSM 10331 / JCM 15462 / NBRC 103882 / ICP) TaxID=525909 RepID=C7M232_ACIFD|nr:hypothetical protein [Acidimicrobium ferrooxidans]ACU53130.1 hypothetical protein Afer_0161 [Acidimicrobium ferrooxidans DSM 10331]
MRLPWRVWLSVISAALVATPSVIQADHGYTSWANVLEHFLVALVVLWIAYSVLATVIAWYELEGMVRRRQARQAAMEQAQQAAPRTPQS